VADIVAAFAASHVPLMVQRPEAAAAEQRDRAFGCFTAMGRRIAGARPEALVMISNEHMQNFFLNNLPTVCIGMADCYEGPIESWIKLPQRTQRGDADLGAHLFARALADGFDPSRSLDLKLDHGTLAPLHLAQIDADLPVVPIMFNNVEPPLPTMRRCLDWGTCIGRAVRDYAGLERVAVLATGGLSHDVGTPNMGATDPAFDREFLRLLATNETDELLRFSQERASAAGNGTEEVRNWIVARGIVGDAPMDVSFYDDIPAWYTGVSIVEWKV
jgi:aromatic ring-opening dioxygenase catalytic subunit (LigB family)